MLNRLYKLNYRHRAELLEQASQVLADWEELGNPELVWDGYQHEVRCHNDDESVLVLYRCCECGKYVTEQEEYGDDLQCPHCGQGCNE